MVRLSHIGHSTHLISRPTYPIRSTVRSTIHRCSSVVVQVSTEGGCRGAFPLAALGIRRGMGTHPPRWGLGQCPNTTAIACSFGLDPNLSPLLSCHNTIDQIGIASPDSSWLLNKEVPCPTSTARGTGNYRSSSTRGG